MKKQLLLALGMLSALSATCQWVLESKPDLVCSISRSGNNVVVTITNWPPNSKKCARSTAAISIAGANQSIAVPELGPEGTFTQNFPIPAAALAGPVKVGVKVDSGERIDEKSEVNNTCVVTLNQPDLEAVLIPGHDILATRTDAQFLYFSIKNTGDGPAGASSARFTYFLANQQKQVIQVPTPPIPAGGRVELRVSPNTCSSLPPSGDCIWQVQIDSGNLVPESDENNNSAGGSRQG